MAKGTGTKGGVLKQKEQARETRSFQNKSAGALESVDKNLKDLTKGISALNANVNTIKVIEAANLAFDIKSAMGAKKISKQIDARIDEMSARNEAGLHDISKGIGKLHSLFTGEDKDQAEARQSRIRSERKDSLFKHRKMLHRQRDFLKGAGKDRITELTKDQQLAWDDEARAISASHKKSRPVNLDNIGSLVSGGGSGSGGTVGGRNTPARAFAKLLQNTNTTNLKLDEVIEILRGNKKLEAENKREGGVKKSRFSKTSKVALGIGGLLGLAGVAAGSLLEGWGAKKVFDRIRKPSQATTAAKKAQLATKKAAEALAKKKAAEAAAKKIKDAALKKAAEEKAKKLAIEATKKAAKAKAAQAAADKAAKAAAAKKLAQELLKKKAAEKAALLAKEKVANEAKAAAIKKAATATAAKNAAAASAKAALLKKQAESITERFNRVSKKWGKNKLWAFLGKRFAAVGLAAMIPGAGTLIAVIGTALLFKDVMDAMDEFDKISKQDDDMGQNVPKEIFKEIHTKASTQKKLVEFGIQANKTAQFKGYGDDWYTKPEHAKIYEQFQRNLNKHLYNYNEAHGLPEYKGGNGSKVNSDNTSNSQTNNFYGIPGNIIV